MNHHVCWTSVRWECYFYSMHEHLPKRPDVIYLNSGSHSLTPIAVLEKQKFYLDEYEKNPTQSLFQAWAELWRVQQLLAPLFDADPKDIFLRDNVTQVLNEFILGLKLPNGSEILTTNQEYGAIDNICRFRSERDQLPLRRFAMPKRSELRGLTAQNLLDRFIDAIDRRTQVIVISEIFTAHGLHFPIQELARFARSRGIYTIIDGAHAPGYLDLDLSALGVDFYAGNLHKWWMGPKGTAFGWLRRDCFEKLRPLQAGWTSFQFQQPFLGFADGDLMACRLLMSGCQNFSSFFALAESVRFWQAHGIRNLQQKKIQIDEQLLNEADQNLQLDRLAFQDPQLQGPLHSFILPSPWAEMEFSQLMAKIFQRTQVQISITNIESQNHLRLSPHIYNTREEISLAIQRLNQFFS